MHLPTFNWEPVILTVHEQYYEEKPDWNLAKLIPSTLRVEKVRAFGITKPRLVGDIGLRAFVQLVRKGREIIEKDKIDFLYIPIPSFYVSLVARILHRQTGIPYGIDYIDPWVHRFPGSEKLFSRHWFSMRLAAFLEPIAVKKARLITGVAEGYYADVLKRNPRLANTVVTGAMPYGGEQSDHDAISVIDIQPYLFDKKTGKIQLVYAGAMLPRAYEPLRAIMRAIQTNRSVFEQVEFHFIGTGKTPNDPNGFNVRQLAQQHDLWETIVFEYPRRIPYLDVLVHLSAADGVFVLGSTEPHYTPSKMYQAVLSKKPVAAVLHRDSTAVKVLVESGAGIALTMTGDGDMPAVEEKFTGFFISYLKFLKQFNPERVNLAEFDKYSAKKVTGVLAGLLDEALHKQTV